MLSNDFLAAAMSATPEQLEAALRLLQGRQSPDASAAQERFITAAELSRTLGFSRMTLWRWNVPCHAFAGKPRFLVSEVLAYFDSPKFQAMVQELKANNWVKTGERKRPSITRAARQRKDGCQHE